MEDSSEPLPLEDLGVVRVRGPQTVAFLQGQLSNDVTRLSEQRSLLAGYHNPQGRAIALLRLVQWQADDVLCVLPRELARTVASRLAKFVLRAKAQIADESDRWRVSGILQAPAPLAATLPALVHAQARVDGGAVVRVGVTTSRWLLVHPSDRAPVELGPPPASSTAREAHGASTDRVCTGRETWQQLDVRDGQPQIYAATTEQFVAQMLNLDLLDAVAFDKGCYTGQEVIARAHYRGRVKRRMQRFVARAPCRLAPGDAGELADGRTFKVVLAAPLADGGCDFLAVAPLAAGERTADVAPVAPTPVVIAEPAPLPYALPD